jgi:hypothetical protein
MPCSNCYNGCPEIISDQCVKYTGIDIPVLGIKNGDSLSYVEQALSTYLVSVIDGSGIKLNINPSLFCELINNYLSGCEEITALNLFQALIGATCDLQGQITNLSAQVAPIYEDYDVACLPGVFAYSGTHDILQATISKLCEVDASLTALALDLSTNYVQLADLNTLIQAYLDSLAPGNQYYNKMIPYTVVEYYGPLTNFDITGAGVGQWEKIYLCNGLNGTPDKRGRVGVGAIVGIGGGPMSPVVDPATPGGFNPNYDVFTTAGSNSVLLNTNQIPAHTHVATVTVTPNPHSHNITITTSGSDAPNGVPNYPVFNSTTDGGGSTATNPIGMNGTSTVDLTVDVTNSSIGGGLAHSNNQPALGCYYIMYIP